MPHAIWLSDPKEVIVNVILLDMNVLCFSIQVKLFKKNKFYFFPSSLFLLLLGSLLPTFCKLTSIKLLQLKTIITPKLKYFWWKFYTINSKTWETFHKTIICERKEVFSLKEFYIVNLVYKSGTVIILKITNDIIISRILWQNKPNN